MRPEVERFLADEAKADRLERAREWATRILREHRRTVVDPVPAKNTLEAMVEAARRRLPPEAWCEMAEAEATRLGMSIAWEVYDPEDATKRRCWATVKTARGATIVAPKPLQTWQAAFAEVGIEPGEAPE